MGPDLHDSDGQKAPFLLTLGCPAWTVDGMVSIGSKRSNALDALRNKSSNKSASSLLHRSPNTSPSLQVSWRLLWAAETTKVLLINCHKPPSLKFPLLLRGAWHSHCPARLKKRDRGVTHGAEVASRKAPGKTFDWSLADFCSEVEGLFPHC